MSTITKFFITGATGYVGGTVLERFLDHPSAGSWTFTALVRSKDKAAVLQEAGVIPILGDLSDSDIVEKAASEADVVMAIANSDDLDGAKATLRGLKKRFEATGKAPILIHVSGTGVIAVDSRGNEKTEEIYDDMNADQIEALSPNAPHRPVDLEIVTAGKEGYVKTYIVIPPNIYGLANTRFVKAGIQNAHSMGIPSLIKAALARGQSGMIGEGKNVWSNVEVHDLADAFVVLYDAIVDGTNSALAHGREGYYFAENGEHTYYDLTKAIGSALVKLGKATSPEPLTFTEDEVKKYFGGFYWHGTNSRSVANRTKALGWDPKKTTKDMLDSVLLEVEAILVNEYRLNHNR